MRELIKGGYYRHFKDHWYRVMDAAEHTETRERLVIYSPLYGCPRLYARPMEMFMEEVPPEKDNPTGQKYRFMGVNELGLTDEDVHFK